ncbi:MAG: CoA pyrophosphatase [Candidatus Bathyarchaeota archaeon]|nr:CoA pyrophosphatase [Candidatus Bathyarchaeota archaeon]MDH5732783.1 CoA pyrophosphatase [Candidatus Bathyarchaeota archaeon]
MLIYVDIIEKLSKALKLVSEEQDADAAVALMLKPMNQNFKVLFVKRIENPIDPWSGQMAFPGGKRDAMDKHLKQTVVRETLEETNINLRDCCHFLGTLTAIRSTRRPEMKILPFVILLDHEPLIKLSERELEGFVWISLRELVQNKGIAKFGFGEVPAYVIESNVIWGLTYRIIENFLQILKCLQPEFVWHAPE